MHFFFLICCLCVCVLPQLNAFFYITKVHGFLFSSFVLFQSISGVLSTLRKTLIRSLQ